MLKRDLQAVRGDQFLDCLSRLVHGASPCRQSSIKKGKLLANGIFELGIREPRNVVKIGGDSRRLLNVVSDHNSCASLKVVAHFGEEPALYQLVGGRLQIRAADLRTGGEAGELSNLPRGKTLLPFNANFSERCGCSIRSLRG